MKQSLLLRFLILMLLVSCIPRQVEEQLTEMKKDNDSLNQQLVEKNEEVFLLRDSIRISRLRDSVAASPRM